jgi:DNA-binding Lrp family transcriptional regulator
MARGIVEKQALISVLDDLDRRILFYWDMNARAPAAEIARKVRAPVMTVNYRMKRLEERGIVTGSITEINTARFGYNNIKVYFQFQNINKRIEQEIFDYLKSIDHVGWIVGCSGRWDALFCFWARSSHEFFSTFVNIINKFSPYILHKEVIHNMNWFYYNRKWLLEKHLPVQVIKYGGEPVQVKMDKQDRAILQRLAKDGRIPIISLAQQLKQSSQNIINRIRRLEREGVITKYALTIDYGKIGLTFCKTFIYLQNTTTKRLHELYDYCAAEPRIYALTTTLGSWDFELEFEVESFEQMTEIMDRLRLRFADIVKSYESVIITKQSTPHYIFE